jgi:hypothetical protein
MIPDAAVAMLACARIGAVHSVVFGGFAPQSIADRVQDCGTKLVITADEGLRGGRAVPLKANVDAALKMPGTNSVETVLVVRHTGGAVDMQMPRDRWYDAVVDGQPDTCEPERMNAEDPLFILYTSGSTGKPKGVLHTTGGYLVWASYTHEIVFDLKPDDIYWCTADVGWITGHSYIAYGPLANRATSVMFEGVPSWPNASRFWEVVDKHQVTIFYTAPTAIRALMREGDHAVKRTSRKSLRLLGSVGEPINPEAWRWYHDVVGEAAMPDRRHLVADRDRRHPDLAAARRHRSQAGFRHAAAAGRAARAGRCRRQHPGRRNLRQPGAAGFVARADAHGLRRPPALHRHLLQGLPGHVLHQRRLPARCRRLLLDHRPRRRRDQRQRPPHRHRGVESALVSHPRSPKPRSSASRTTSRARASTPTSP